MRKSKAPTTVFIESDADLIKVLKSDISVDTAELIARKYLNVFGFGVKSTVDAKTELVSKVELFLKRFGHLNPIERPLFPDQQQVDFNIKDLYNHKED